MQASSTHSPTPPSDIVYPEMIPFFLVHIAALGSFYTGIGDHGWLWFAALYLFRMFGITAGYHRYFSHRTYKTGRLFQFILAFLGGASAQQGALWWAAKHRDHHKYADTHLDSHSPRLFGFWFSHFGWIFSRSKAPADYSKIQDFAKYPELRWLDRHYYVPPILTGLLVWWFGGASALFFGFFVSTVACWHVTFAINSVAHVMGTRPYITPDDSRNNPVLAILALGEGWHNNHHYYQSAVQQGFVWWQIDISYYLLKLLALFGIVWDLKAPPKAAIEGRRKLSTKALQAGAVELFESMKLHPRLEQLRAAMDEHSLSTMKQNLHELREELHLAASQKSEQLEETIERWKANLEMPEWMEAQLPSFREFATTAQAKFRKSYDGSLDQLAAQSYLTMFAALAY